MSETTSSTPKLPISYRIFLLLVPLTIVTTYVARLKSLCLGNTLNRVERACRLILYGVADMCSKDKTINIK